MTERTLEEQIADLADAAFDATEPVAWPSGRAAGPASSSRRRLLIATAACIALIAGALIAIRISDGSADSTPGIVATEGDAPAPAPTPGDQPAPTASPAVVPATTPRPRIPEPFDDVDRRVHGVRLVGANDQTVFAFEQQSSRLERSTLWAGTWPGDQWTAHPVPGDEGNLGCASVNDNGLILLKTPGTADPQQELLFLDSTGVVRSIVLPLPIQNDDPGRQWSSRWCRPATIDGVVALAATDNTGVTVLSTDDAGQTSTQHRFDFPKDFTAISGSPNWQDGTARVYADGDWFVIEVCAVGSSLCFFFDFAVHKSLVRPNAVESPDSIQLAPGRTDQIRWEVGVPQPSTPFLYEVDGQTWRVQQGEITEQGDPEFLGTTVAMQEVGPAYGTAVPIGTEAASWVRLYPAGNDDIFAEVVIDPTRSGTEPRRSEWWRGTPEGDWTLLNESPLVEWASQPDGTAIALAYLSREPAWTDPETVFEPGGLDVVGIAQE